MITTQPRSKPTRKAHGRRRLSWGPSALCSALLLLAPAAADTVTLNGIDTPGVEIIGIRDGRLVYLTPAGAEVTTSLPQVQAIEIDAHPQYAMAVTLIEEGDHDTAAAALRQVIRSAGRDAAWVRQYAGWRLVQSLDAQRNGVEAARAFAELAGTQPDGFFLQAPPVESVSSVPDDARDKTVALLERSLRRTNDAGRAALQSLLDALRQAETTDNPPPGNGNDAAGPSASDAAAPSEDAGLVLPAALATGNDPVVALLRAGQFDEAITQVDRQFRRNGGRAQQRRYLRAMALLGKAERSEDRDDYLDAGLEFMRVVLLSRNGGAFLAPALVEVAYVHQRIDEPELARTLLDEAGLLLDEEEEPRYYRRYQELLAE